MSEGAPVFIFNLKYLFILFIKEPKARRAACGGERDIAEASRTVTLVILNELGFVFMLQMERRKASLLFGLVLRIKREAGRCLII